jgi:very-short-patch-repair endonuclease
MNLDAVPKKAKLPKAESALEAAMLQQLQGVRLTAGMVREHRFEPARRWRFDFAWPEQKIALETEGGTWSGGRHTRGAGYAADIEKYNRASVLGWHVIRATAEHVRSGYALQIMEQVLKK